MNNRVSSAVREKFCKETLVKVFEYGLTTMQEREEVAARWLAGDLRHHILISGSKSLYPPALIAASLIDCEDIVFAPSGILSTKTYREFFSLIEMVDTTRAPVGAGITTDYTHEIALRLVGNLQKPADKSPKTVDNFPETVDKVVDKYALPVDSLLKSKGLIHSFSNQVVACG